jgi:phosphopantothenate synthetase
VAEEMVSLADALAIPLVVNLFHRSEERVKRSPTSSLTAMVKKVIRALRGSGKNDAGVRQRKGVVPGSAGDAESPAKAVSRGYRLTYPGLV